MIQSMGVMGAGRVARKEEKIILYEYVKLDSQGKDTPLNTTKSV